jgi:carboxyl-terminal processing protease
MHIKIGNVGLNKEEFVTSTKRRFLCSAVLLFLSLPIWNGRQAHTQQDKAVELDGVWRLRGYGKILHIHQGNYTNYDITKISCLPVRNGTLRDLERRFDRFEIHDTDKLSLFSKGGITRYTYDRLSTLPEYCQNDCTSKLKDPEYNFEVFYHSFKENYPFFKLHNVDWDGIYKTYRPKVTAKTTDDELIEIFSAVIKSFNDPHVSLYAGDRWIRSTKPDALGLHIRQEFPSEKPMARFFKSLDKLQSIIKKDFLDVDCRLAANNFIVWGKIKPNIGYLNIFVMGDYAGVRAPRTDSLAVLEWTMDLVMEYFRSVEAVVVDVRFNTGGYDENSIMIANRFADRRRLAFTRKAVFCERFTEKQEFYIRPQGNFQFTGPTFLLTSERTVSAAEIFVICMMAYPHVTRVGGITAGALSDVLTKHLPNGWDLEISNEVCEAADGNVYEGIGIPPQVKVPVFIPGNIYPGLKQAVDKAVFLAEKAIAKKSHRKLREIPLHLEGR